MMRLIHSAKKKWMIIAIAAVILAASISAVALATNGFFDSYVNSSSKPAGGKEDTALVSSEELSAQTPESETQSEEEEEFDVSETQQSETPVSEEPPETSEELIHESSEAPRKNAWREGYVPTHGEPGEIDPGLLKEIQETYAKKHNSSPNVIDLMVPEDVAIRGYCGSYNGCTVGYIYPPDRVVFATVTYEEQIGEVFFFYSVLCTLDVYKDGIFTDIETAYNNGWLSDTDIKDIFCYYKSSPSRG